MTDAWIVIPAYNEERTIADVIEGLRRRGFTRILVVDDGSRDRTAKVAEQRGALVIRHPINRGVGGAIRTGLAAAVRLGASAVVTMDADGQHAPDAVARVLAPIRSGEAAMVVGCRTRSPGMPPLRRLANWIANVLTFLMCGVWTSDSQSGLRALSRVALEKVQIRASGFEVCSELIFEVVRLKLPYREVPIPAVYTSYSLSKGQSLWNGLRTLGHLILRRF